MKTAMKPQQMKILILALGGLGLALRVLLYATGVDEKGLVETGHWANIGLLALTVLTFGAAFLLTRPIHGPECYADSFPPSLLRALGCLGAAIGFLITALEDLSLARSLLDTAVSVLGFLSAAAIAVVGVYRLLGNKPNILLHVAVCLYLALRSVHQYRGWSSDPQLSDYCFYIGAYVALMLACYHLAAFDAGTGSHRKLWLTGLLAVYLCCIGLTGEQGKLFLLLCGLWMLTSLPNLTTRPRRHRPKLHLEQIEE